MVISMEVLNENGGLNVRMENDNEKNSVQFILTNQRDEVVKYEKGEKLATLQFTKIRNRKASTTVWWKEATKRLQEMNMEGTMAEKLKLIEVEAGISSAGGPKAVSQERKEEQKEDATNKSPGCTVCTAWMKQKEAEEVTSARLDMRGALHRANEAGSLEEELAQIAQERSQLHSPPTEEADQDTESTEKPSTKKMCSTYDEYDKHDEYPAMPIVIDEELSTDAEEMTEEERKEMMDERTREREEFNLMYVAIEANFKKRNDKIKKKGRNII